MNTYYEISTLTHPDDVTECRTGWGAYAAASRLVEMGFEPTIIHHGSSGHARCVSWAELCEEYGS